MPSRRPGLSALLVTGAVVLLAAILVGQKLGDRILLHTTRRAPIAGSGVTPVPEAQPTDQGELRNWKRLQVVSVATDPAFPDPRVTLPPRPTLPPYTPAPAVKAPKRATPTPLPTIEPPRGGIYTSPPLPLPLVSHDPDETPPPDAAPPPAEAGAAAPTRPPRP